MKQTKTEYKAHVELMRRQRQSLLTICVRVPDKTGIGEQWLATTLYQCAECHTCTDRPFMPIKPMGRYVSIDTGAIAMGIALGKASLHCPHVGPFLDSVERGYENEAHLNTDRKRIGESHQYLEHQDKRG